LVEVAHELLADDPANDDADFLEQALVLAEQLSPSNDDEGGPEVASEELDETDGGEVGAA